MKTGPGEKSAGTTGQGPGASLFRCDDGYTFIADSRGRYSPQEDARFRNNLLFAVGFLELANAGDFAANVWNDTPVPIFAIVLMAIGGAAALTISIFAFVDASRSWQNIRFLRYERQALKAAKSARAKDPLGTHDVDALLRVNFRELGTEVSNRFIMNILMGGGAVLIGVGTYMAIGGSNPAVFTASNLLSGYIGNTPIALYGLINASWLFHLFALSITHMSLARKVLSGDPALKLLKRRALYIRLYTATSGLASVLGGVGSMITATRWWGYVILIPVILSSIFCNILFRHGIGYGRPNMQVPQDMSLVSLTEELHFVSSILSRLNPKATDQLGVLAADRSNWPTVMSLIQANDLLEDFGSILMRTPSLAKKVIKEYGTKEIKIDAADLAEIPEEYVPEMLVVAETCVRMYGPRRFANRQAILIEVVWNYMGESGMTQS